MPPMEFLSLCSVKSLQDFELARLNRCANLRKELRALEDELRTAEAEALLAAWLQANRERLALRRDMHDLQKPLDFVGAALVEAAPVHALEGHVYGDANLGG